MKIIATTAGGHLVEMSTTEIMRAAGYVYPSDIPDGLTERSGFSERFRVGVEIEFANGAERLRRLHIAEDEVRSKAALLRGLADMIEGIVPVTVKAPDEPGKEDHNG